MEPAPYTTAVLLVRIFSISLLPFALALRRLHLGLSSCHELTSLFLERNNPRDVQRDKLKQRGEKQRSSSSIVKKPRKALTIDISQYGKATELGGSRKEIRPTEIG